MSGTSAGARARARNRAAAAVKLDATGPAQDSAQVSEETSAEQGNEPAAQVLVPASAANETPLLPPGLATSAARAHAMLTHVAAMARAMQSDIERFVEPDVLRAAEREVGAYIRSVL